MAGCLELVGEAPTFYLTAPADPPPPPIQVFVDHPAPVDLQAAGLGPDQPRPPYVRLRAPGPGNLTTTAARDLAIQLCRAADRAQALAPLAVVEEVRQPPGYGGRLDDVHLGRPPWPDGMDPPRPGPGQLELTEDLP